jgi:hypothetical protein
MNDSNILNILNDDAFLWFANAIEHSYNVRRWKQEKQEKDIEHLHKTVMKFNLPTNEYKFSYTTETDIITTTIKKEFKNV